MKKTFIITLVLVFVSSFHIEASASEAQIIENYGNIPLAFTLNRGQVDSQVKFTTQGNGCSLFFKPSGTTFLLSRETEESIAKRAAKRSVVYMEDPIADSKSDIELEHFALKLHFLNANPAPEIVGEDRLSWSSNYFIGNDPSEWRTDVPNYSKISLKDIYDGIDLVYYGGRKSIKYDFIVQPGENPSEIMLNYDFGDSEGLLSINEKGELVVATPLGDIIERKPYCYQIIEGKKIEIDINYEIIDSYKGSFRFSIGDYNQDYSLIIDPELVYSTYIGGRDEDFGMDIALDSDGCVYMTGLTLSTDFPVTSGAFNEEYNTESYILKLNADGSDLVYAAFFSGFGDCYGFGIAVDANDNAYMCGSGGIDFPVTPGAYDETYNGNGDGFILKLNPDGNDILYATFIGGSDGDGCYRIVVDDSGRVYIAVRTDSSDFPVTPGAYDETHNGAYDIAVLSLSADGSNLIYATYVGGSDLDEISDIALDENGCVYITGTTLSSDFPVTPGAFDETYNGDWNGFIFKLNTDGSDLMYATFIGNSPDDGVGGIAVDSSGIAYVTGCTRSTDFPVTSGAFDETYNGNRDGFLLKLNADGTDLVYATFIGGISHDCGGGISLDANGFVYLTGSTSSTDFPVTPDSYDETYDNDEFYSAVFIMKLNADCSELDYSTFVQGRYDDSGHTIILDGNGDAYVMGSTYSHNFPVTPGAFDESFNNEYAYIDIFIVKFSFKDVGTSEETIPSSFRVSAPYPNPFNPLVTLEYDIPSDSFVKLVIYDILGREVVVLQNDFVKAGTYRALWNGSDSKGDLVAGGVYLYKFESKGFNKTGKMLLMK